MKIETERRLLPVEGQDPAPEGDNLPSSGKSPVKTPLKRVKGTQLSVSLGDITELDVDAIVNAANNHLWMGSGVAGAIRRKGGIGIQTEAVAQGPIEIGESIVTGAGTLKARHVIHAAAMGQDLSTDEEKIDQATRSALARAMEIGARTVAFPALGTGVGGFPMKDSALLMVKAVIACLNKNPDSFSEILFAVIDEGAAEAFRQAIHGPGN